MLGFRLRSNSVVAGLVLAFFLLFITDVICSHKLVSLPLFKQIPQWFFIFYKMALTLDNETESERFFAVFQKKC